MKNRKKESIIEEKENLSKIYTEEDSIEILKQKIKCLQEDKSLLNNIYNYGGKFISVWRSIRNDLKELFGKKSVELDKFDNTPNKFTSIQS